MPTDNTPDIRDDKGRFPAGVSGNPAGRPLGAKGRITKLKQDFELAVRDHFNEDEIKAVISSMVREAVGGNVSAAKLLLDKVMTNATSEDDPTDGNKGIRIVIENATFGALEQDSAQPAPIEGESTREE